MGKISDPNAPVPFPYPSALSSSGVSYPFLPSGTSHKSSDDTYCQHPSVLQEGSALSNSHISHLLKPPSLPLPPPQFTELVNMCIDIQISDISVISQLCVVTMQYALVEVQYWQV